MSKDPELVTWQLGQVRRVLTLLAADPDVQLAELKRIGTLPSLDELALEFNDVQDLVPGLVRDEAAPAKLDEIMRRLDTTLADMSFEPDLWTSNAIDRPEWRSIRSLSREAAALLQSRNR